MAYQVEQNKNRNIRWKLLPKNNIQQKCRNFGKSHNAKDSGETIVIKKKNQVKWNPDSIFSELGS